ncbi:MAG: SemiSWEET family transporter [Candidatus Pacearchaeota archaeon]
MEIIEYVGFFAGLLVAISSLPQLVKSWETKSTKDIAIGWLLINIFGQILWICYGFLKNSVSLIVMSFITLLMVGSVLILKLKYR